MPRVATEPLAPVEDELRLELRQPVQHRRELLLYANQTHLVAVGQQRPGDIVFRLLDLRLHLLAVVGVFPVGVQRVEHDGDLHARTLAISFPTVVRAIKIRRPPNAPAVGSSSIAGRNPTRSERYPMSGGAMASPARCENSR